jgi:hypothetical protein
MRAVDNLLLCNKSLFIYQGKVLNEINHGLSDSIITLKKPPPPPKKKKKKKKKL